MTSRLQMLIFWIIVLLFFTPIIINWNFYTRSYEGVILAQKYSNSQYVKGSGGDGIGDDGLYAFAGNYYFNGGDPTQVNFENPPLGKYLIGLSIFLFQNENMIYIFYAFIILINTYLLAHLVFDNKWLALLGIVVLMSTHMFQIQYLPTSPEQRSVSLLDLPLTMFLLLSTYFFVRAKLRIHDYIISSFFLGCALATKFFPAIIIVLFVQFLYVFINRKNHLKRWFASLLTIPSTYLISYSAFFKFHFSLIEFLKFHKYMISWRLGNPVVPGNIFRTILTGSYTNWWDKKIVLDTEWTFSFPLLVSLGLLGGIIAIRQKRTQLIFIWALCVLFLIYLSIGTVGIARYLLPIFPFLVILAINNLSLKKIFTHHI